MAKKKGGLGRGLDALFADAEPIFEEEESEKIANEITAGEVINSIIDNEKEKNDEDYKDKILYIDINDIKPNADQPRKTFNEEKLNELADSIKKNGVIQPLVVRKNGDGFELVAGERRWRASRIANLRKIPCIVREFDEQQNVIVAIIENMQREDLDPIEEANGLQQMVKRFNFTQEQVSSSLGKSRAYIANSLRLLKLPTYIQDYIINGKMSAAHGRTVINISDEEKRRELCEKIVENGLSVRESEKLAEKIKDGINPERKKRTKPKKDAETKAVEDELMEIFTTKVNILKRKSSGKIEIEYYSTEELNRIIDILRSVSVE